MVLEAPNQAVMEKWVAQLALVCGDSGSTPAADPAVEGVLFAEGYITKMKPGFSGLNRSRWFRVLSTGIEYFETEEGPLLASCAADNIDSIMVVGELRFEVRAAPGPSVRRGQS